MTDKLIKYAAFALILSCFSCTREEIQETATVSLEFCPITVKTTLNAERSQLVWEQGDKISVFNNATGDRTLASYDSTSPKISIQLPLKATSIKATYPVTEGSYAQPEFVFSRNQTQTKAGSLNGTYYPIVSESAVSDGSAKLYFSPAGSAFAINVYNPRYSSEKLISVSVQPSSFETPVVVTLGESWTLLKDKPTDKKNYPGQVYACIEKGSYSEITFIVTTSAAKYVITSNSTAMPLDKYDFFAVNLDLDKLKVYVDFENELEPFSYYEIDATSVQSSFVDLIENGLEPQLTNDTIPDFSTVGYRWSEKGFPDYSNVIELGSPSGGDDTDMIQAAIDNAPDNSVILFKKGKYIVDSLLFITRSNIILRGSGNKETEIFARGTVPLSDVDPKSDKVFYRQIRNLINVGYCNSANRAKRISNSVAALTVSNTKGVLLESHADAWQALGTGLNSSWTQNLGNETAIIEDVYCGSTFVTVKNASAFNVGDRVIVYRNSNAKWIHDIKMDMIIKALTDIGTITQWSAGSYKMSWERVIKAIHGNRLYFDAPLVQSITAEYGGGSVIHCSSTRVKEVGIENLKLVSDYNSDRDYKRDSRIAHGDIYHANDAITIQGAEHCWVKGIDTYFFASCAVAMGAGAKNITVDGCNQHEPSAYIIGGLRYAFHINGGTNCLVKNCTSDWDRHQWVTAAKVPGPNVFYNCSSTNALSNVGPHQRWATGTLYDHVVTTASVTVVDAGNSGTGQGWQGANQVFWRCTGSKFCVQSPWVSAKNYAIGCLLYSGGDAVNSEYNPYPNPGYDPNGNIVNDRDVNGTRIMSELRALRSGEPESLYLHQLQRRLDSGELMSNLITD